MQAIRLMVRVLRAKLAGGRTILVFEEWHWRGASPSPLPRFQ